MIDVWKAHQDEYPETAKIVQAGLDKLESYSQQTDLVPAHTLPMCLSPFVILFLHPLISFPPSS